MAAEAPTARKMRKQATREQLLAAATCLLAKDGYAALRVAAVAKAAHVSPGGFLHHFPSKESLVIAVLERLSERALDAARDDAGRRACDIDILDHISQSATRFYAAPEFLIYVDIFLSARRGTAIGEAATKLLLAQRTATEALWMPLLLERGVNPELAAAAVHAIWALARGLAISSARHDGVKLDAAATKLMVDSLRTGMFR